MTQDELLAKIEALDLADDQQRNQIVCALIGHSNILTAFLGYHYCARCEAQVGDSLGGVYSNNNAVYVGHNCETCRANYERLDWMDKLFCPDPFTEVAA